MWLPFHPIVSLAAGLFGTIQQHFNITSSHNNLTRLTESQYAEYIPYIQFARAAYCNSSKIHGWKCGAACNAVPGFNLTLAGGDGDNIQFYFVGYWPAHSSVVVAHQGTDPHKIWADWTDVDFKLVAPDRTLFPPIPTNVEVHDGFAQDHKKTANTILAEVRKLMAEHSSTKVVLVGHSLGGALAELDSLFMKLNLPAGTTVQGFTFGTPRVGNKAWATFFDSHVPEFKRMNNKRDPIPTWPGREIVLFHQYRHPSGEIHLEEDGSAVVCPGPDDDDDLQCSDKMVPDFWKANVSHHNGPYGPHPGILIGTLECTP